MDIDYLLWLQGLRQAAGSTVENLFVFISEFGMPTIPLLLVFVIYWCFHKKAGIYLLFACNVSAFFNGIIKLCCTVYRPWIRDSRITPAVGAMSGATGYSFPSGHSTQAAAAYGGMAYQGRKHKALVWGMSILVLLVMFSRNYCGVHTPQDVLVGAALGLITLWIVKRLLDFVENKAGNRDLWVAVVGTIIGLLTLVFVTLKPYPMDVGADGLLLVDPVRMQKDHFGAVGALIGMLWGWLWERRQVGFTTDVKGWVRLARAATGILISFLLLYTLARHGLQAVLGLNWGDFVGVTLTMLYATGVHPWLFTLVERKLSKGAAQQAQA
ncbi:MAG: phosphatase PAP2 family protein [Eubacteriales bacterium]|nr:phosphatase PAP2 family protein [Eubacteriales bacterium]